MTFHPNDEPARTVHLAESYARMALNFSQILDMSNDEAVSLVGEMASTLWEHSHQEGAPLPPPVRDQSWLVVPDAARWHYFIGDHVYAADLYDDPVGYMRRDWNEYNPVKIDFPPEEETS